MSNRGKAIFATGIIFITLAVSVLQGTITLQCHSLTYNRLSQSGWLAARRYIPLMAFRMLEFGHDRSGFAPASDNRCPTISASF